MEKYKKLLSKRVVSLSVVIGVFVILEVALLTMRDKLPAMPDFIAGFQAGVVIGVVLCGVFLLVRTILALRNEEALKKLYIKEHDERSVYVQQKSGALSFAISTVGLLIAIIISGYFNTVVFFTLLTALAFILLVRLALKLYYRTKY